MTKWNFEIERIKRTRTKCRFLQFPDGLLIYAPQIVDQLDGDNYISLEPCYGACDVRHFSRCLTVHFGHSDMGCGKALYIEARSDVDPLPVVKKALGMLSARVGLITTVQHAHTLKKVKRFLAGKGISALIGDAGPRCRYPGQVLGCDWHAAEAIAQKVDQFLYIGSGRFHPLAVAWRTKKEVIAADPFTKKVERITGAQMERERWIRIAKAQNASTFGIIISTKPGQRNIKAAKTAKRQIEKKHRRAYLLVIDTITPQKLDYFPVDAYIITACPRIVLDDWRNYKKPLILPEEIKLLP